MARKVRQADGELVNAMIGQLEPAWLCPKCNALVIGFAMTPDRKRCRACHNAARAGQAARSRRIARGFYTRSDFNRSGR